MRRFVVAVCICTFVGCGKGGLATYPVAGRVSFADGKPLHGGTVEFQPAGEHKGMVSARGRIQPDGKYSMSTFAEGDGVIEGKHRVLVVSPLPPGPVNSEHPSPPIINVRFQNYDTSGLEFAVTPKGPNTFDITVTPP